MKELRNIFSLVLAALTLVAGCQTAPTKGAGAGGTAQPQAPAPEPQPAVSVPAPESPLQAGTHESAPEPADATMSTMQLQQRLTDLGYKPGVVDGMSGPRTTNALKKFQHDHHLATTGTLDDETIRELRKP